MEFPDEVMEVVDYQPKVDKIYNNPSIADADVDKEIFSNNYVKTGPISCINTDRESTTDASNVNACNLNASMVYRTELEDKLQDEDTLATVTRTTAGISTHMAKMLGATIVPDPDAPVDPEPED